jgi:hypothetical protein
MSSFIQPLKFVAFYLEEMFTALSVENNRSFRGCEKTLINEEPAISEAKASAENSYERRFRNLGG